MKCPICRKSILHFNIHDHIRDDHDGSVFNGGILYLSKEFLRKHPECEHLDNFNFNDILTEVYYFK